MTFKGFKDSLNAKLKPRGDVNLPSDDILIPLIKDALDEVALYCDPLHLICSDFDFGVLKFIDEDTFIRVPNVPQNEDDDIDIDDRLVGAVIYLVLHQISKVRKNASFEAKKIMIDYDWYKYEVCV
jgi:hypothetical protein